MTGTEQLPDMNISARTKIFAKVAVVTLCCGDVMSAEKGPETDLQEIVQLNDELLAFKKVDGRNDENKAAAAVVRHSQPDANGNTCELLILQRTASEWVVKERSGSIVDCLFNDLARNATDLSANLTVSDGKIIYVNQAARSNVTFELRYDKSKNTWFLFEARSASPSESQKTGKMGVVIRKARFPDDIPFTPLSQIDAEAVQAIMDKHQKTLD
ncbi:hypothetical protein [Rhizobium sp. 22-785-1]